MLRIAVVFFVLVLLVNSNTSVNAHMAFKNTISKKYPDMTVTCNACHVDKKPKTERNEFGKLFAKELKQHDISATFKSKTGADRKVYEKVTMIPEFTKALEKIKQLKPQDGELIYDELIKTGQIAEITKKSDSKKAN